LKFRCGQSQCIWKNRESESENQNKRENI